MNFIHALLGKIVAFRYLGTFNKQLRVIRVVLWSELSAEYQRELDVDMAKTLAAQVVNYLLGEDLEAIRANASEPAKSQIGRVWDQIAVRAEQKMAADKLICRLVVYTHRMKTVLLASKRGPAYMNCPENKRSVRILEKYGPAFTEEVAPGIYDQTFSRFLKEKKEFVPGGKS